MSSMSNAIPDHPMPNAPLSHKRRWQLFFESFSKSTAVTALHLSEAVLLLSGLVLLVGIWGEYSKSDKWKTAFQIMVLAGIGGELISDAGVFVFSESLQRLEGADIQALDRKAGDASRKAADVETRADALGLILGDEQDAARDLSARIVSLRGQIMQQGPRWQLLEAGKIKFINALKPFHGHPITVVTCGQPLREKMEIEPYRLEQEILDFVGKDGAGWIIGYKSWERCGTGGGTSYGGNRIVFNSAASADVKEAAKTLYNVLNELGIATVTFEVGSDSRRQEVFFSGTDSPEVLAIDDPKSIFLLVGSNPMFDVAGFKQSKAPKKRH